MVSETWLITGANRGLGLEFVRQLATRGCRVLAGCRRPAEAKELLAWREAGKLIEPFLLDVADPAQVRQAMATIVAQQPTIDVLVNNAGIGANDEPGLMAVDEEQMVRVFHTNAVGPLSVTREAVPLLRKSSHPRVVTLTSGSGLLKPELPSPNQQLSYRGTKAALHIFTQQMAADLQEMGITVIGMAPGFVLTDMTRGASVKPPLLPPESVTGMLKVIDSLRLEQTGRFYSFNGLECRWYVK